MSEISDYIDFSGTDHSIITSLMQKNVHVPSWCHLRKLYNYKEHKILFDTVNLRDKIRKDGSVEKSSRYSIGMERLLVRRMSEFMFSIPVKRVYHNTDNNAVRQTIARAIEAIYKYSRLKTHNLKRSKAFYAACEIATLWYAVKKPNKLYGFESQYKLKCKTFSPMDGYELYPYFDEYGDMLAFSFKYSITVNNETKTYFETYTSDTHYKWIDDGGWRLAADPEEVIIMKIPVIYLSRPEAIYEEVSYIREEIEYTLSRNSNVIAYNSAPILKIIGEILGDREMKNEDQRMFRMNSGGDVGYVSWNQAIEALKYNVQESKELFWSLTQMPDISFSNMSRLGNIGYDARETLLTDAHLKVGDESGDWIEFFEREDSVIKSFLKMMNTAWENEIDEVEVEHIITPFIQRNETAEITKRMAANGGKPIESHLESIKRYGQSNDPQETLDMIRKEQAEETQIAVPDVFGSAN